ncbi:hypothetical protein F2P79_015943 [Pimephales promelas]|nr:hypothetical protein F2P79_015943 [Pimephales promelas]
MPSERQRSRMQLGMMAGRMKTLSLLILFSLLSLTEHFEVRDDEWEELSPDIAALHRLRGLSEHMSHERFKNASNQRDTSIHGARVRRSSSRDFDRNPMSLQDDLQACDKSFTACVIQMEQHADSFLEAVDEHKVQDRLIAASEISHSYRQKLLVMTDKEKSTQDRVQQEYSMDPHYSVIVSKECLFNVSCVPEAGSDTVVKIFGRVSEDGQTVSGLSGSSLAELMLKPSLEDAPVFSLDGNTTTDFQHHFIRVFVVQGIKAVLETKQENHQIYQVMNQHDSVSRYQIPQRAVDHSTQYDHQQILIMQDDPTVRKAAIYLHEKHPEVTSVYVLDNNQRPKLIKGASVPLSENSRLTLVGHGERHSSGEMRLAGYTAQDVAKIIQRTSRTGDKIKTINVVACEVGSDKEFVKTLLRELRETANIETELHLRSAVLQVRHTGEKITQEISKEGLRWRHNDDSKKVVATLDRNGHVIIRTEPGRRGEEIFTNERNFLMPEDTSERFKVYRDSWPNEPRRFIDQEVFDQNLENANQIRTACDELEALSWGLFHSDLSPPKKMKENVNLEEYVMGIRIEKNKINNNNNYNNKKIKKKHEINWITDERELKAVLSEYYEIKSGEDVIRIIRHYAKNGENKLTYLMVKDWIYEVNPRSLYVYPVGKKLSRVEQENQRGDVKACIIEQLDKESYKNIQEHITDKNSYVEHVENIFLGHKTGEHTTRTQLSTEAWRTTYFTASVISESARNFRTFPLTLMALDLTTSDDNNIREKGLEFFFEEHSMAREDSWIDPSRRGFSGSATPEDSSKLNNFHNKKNKMQLMDALKIVVKKEADLYQSWIEMVGNNIESRLFQMVEKYKITESNSDEKEKIIKNYNNFKTEIEKPSGPSTSGTLGGYNDGHVTSQDLKSASKLESSFKLESYFSRGRVLSAEQIHNHIKAKYGEDLAGLYLQEGSARIEDGQFIGRLVSQRADTEPVEFRVELSPESQHYNEKMLKSIETAVHELEGPVSSHHVNKYVEHAGTAVGAVGLMLGMKGAVRAFENGDIKDGVVGALQTTHGVAAMTTAVIAKQTLSSNARISRAAATVMKSSAMKGFMTVIPVAGIGFGIYNFEQDLERNDTLGNIDAGLDGAMIGLDVIELVQPELAPIIAPINLALSAVRLVIDDVYMGIQDELNNLPKESGVLGRLMAGLRGFGKGILHSGIHVAAFFYNWRYDEIKEGHRYVEQISDFHKYYRVTKEQDRTSAIDFNSADSAWNGGGIHFCLADQGQSELCMDYFVSSDESFGKNCWKIDTQGSKDIILGLGESHQLEYQTLQKKVLLIIPAGTVKVVSGYKAVSESRYGIYRGNKDSNRFFAVQKAEDQHVIEVMLSYYYTLYGEPGDDLFFLGPQKSYVTGAGGKDTYIIPKNGGKTIINNYDPSKALDTLHFSVDYSHISASKSGDDVVLMYEDSHTVTITNWFLGEPYRHMTMMSGDGVLFEISSIVYSSVHLAARGINKMFKTQGETVDASLPLLSTVTNIVGSPYDDVLIGNGENNLMDGGGGRDRLIGGEGEDIYIVDNRWTTVYCED